MKKKHEVIIIGSGPAGLTAAIYCSRARLEPLCIAGYKRGGQLMITSEVENFPGFPEGIQGPELMERFRKQAERFGTQFIDKDATGVDFSQKPFKVMVEDETFEANAVIIATGADAKWLGLESEQRLIGRGVSSCATCDGAFFRDKIVYVVGGGDSAVEEATFLTRFAKEVHLVHRRDQLRASKIMQERLFASPKVQVHWDSVVEEVLGKDLVEGVRLKNVKTGETSEHPCHGFFVAIGHKPNTEIFKGQIEMDDQGYIIVHNETQTSVEGVFVAGDVHDKRYRQAITASGLGCMAALDTEKYLEAHHSQHS
ncbi:MAG: thioredoxin-disulfide reductase [Planctomycetota bacterium]|nr:MAG: thioredoxin-disulfide reductase [Planctomycetota bacterium]